VAGPHPCAVRLRTSGGRPNRPCYARAELEPVSQSRPIKLPPGSSGDMTVTLFY